MTRHSAVPAPGADPVTEVMGCWQPTPIGPAKRQFMLDELLVGLRTVRQDFDAIEWREPNPTCSGWVALKLPQARLS